MTPAPSTPDLREKALARSELWRIAAALFRYPSCSENELERLCDPASWENAGRAARLLENPELARKLSGAEEAFLPLSADAIEASYDRAGIDRASGRRARRRWGRRSRSTFPAWIPAFPLSSCSASRGISVPADPSLAGGTFYAQWYAADGPAPFPGSVTPALECVIQP